MALAEVVQVQTAVASREEGARIAEALLTRRLAACVQLAGPVHSRYWWQGALESSEEWLCLVKTTSGGAAAAVEAIASAHSYDNPEIIVTPILDGSPAYLRWVADEVRP